MWAGPQAVCLGLITSIIDLWKFLSCFSSGDRNCQKSPSERAPLTWWQVSLSPHLTSTQLGFISSFILAFFPKWQKGRTGNTRRRGGIGYNKKGLEARTSGHVALNAAGPIRWIQQLHDAGTYWIVKPNFEKGCNVYSAVPPSHSVIVQIFWVTRKKQSKCWTLNCCVSLHSCQGHWICYHAEVSVTSFTFQGPSNARVICVLNHLTQIPQMFPWDPINWGKGPEQFTAILSDKQAVGDQMRNDPPAAI